MKSRKEQYTEQALMNAFLHLLETTPAEKISVTQLCQEADVHRSTFYKKYEDIYAFEKEISEHLYSAFFEDAIRMLEKSTAPENMQARPVMLHSLKTIKKYRPFLKMIFAGQFSDECLNRMYNSMRREVSKMFEPSENLNLQLDFLTGGLSYAVRGYIFEEYNVTDEEFIDLLIRLMHAVMWDFNVIVKKLNAERSDGFADSACLEQSAGSSVRNISIWKKER